jgi:hypothetical protein
VFAYVTDPARFKEWQKGVVDGHGRPGRRYPGPGRGRQVRDDAAHRRRQPPVHVRAGANRSAPGLGRRGTDGPIRAAVDVLVEPVTGSRSRLTISVDFTGHGIGKILVPPMVRREARKEMPDNIAALKRLIEEG